MRASVEVLNATPHTTLCSRLLGPALSFALSLSHTRTSLVIVARSTDNKFDPGLLKAIRAQPHLQNVAIVGIAEVVAPYTTPRVDLQHTKELFAAKGFDDIIARPPTSLTAASMAALVERWCIRHCPAR